MGRKSARWSPNQCQAPFTGTEVVRSMCFSICRRAFGFTGVVKAIEIGIATPTVVWPSGAMLSSSIGGPLGECFFAFFLGWAADVDDGELFAPADGDCDPESPAERVESAPLQADVVSSTPAA